MSKSVARTVIGPRDPFTPLGAPTVVKTNDDGSVLKSQAFEDGTLYQLSVPRGSRVGTIDIPNAVWMNVHSPLDVGDSDDKLYLSFWVANG